MLLTAFRQFRTITGCVCRLRIGAAAQSRTPRPNCISAFEKAVMCFCWEPSWRCDHTSSWDKFRLFGQGVLLLQSVLMGELVRHPIWPRKSAFRECQQARIECTLVPLLEGQHGTFWSRVVGVGERSEKQRWAAMDSKCNNEEVCWVLIICRSLSLFAWRIFFVLCWSSSFLAGLLWLRRLDRVWCLPNCRWTALPRRKVVVA